MRKSIFRRLRNAARTSFIYFQNLLHHITDTSFTYMYAKFENNTWSIKGTRVKYVQHSEKQKLP